jgi:hypothetical protein
MPRPVAIRASYRNDAAFLLRFEEAVSKDLTQSEEWRRRVCEKTRELAQLILTAKGSRSGQVASQPAVEKKK